jgi:hypothetical protein
LKQIKGFGNLVLIRVIGSLQADSSLYLACIYNK